MEGLRSAPQNHYHWTATELEPSEPELHANNLGHSMTAGHEGTVQGNTVVGSMQGAHGALDIGDLGLGGIGRREWGHGGMGLWVAGPVKPQNHH